MQDSFLTIFKKINQYNNKGSFEGWIKRITINTALQKYREKVPLQLVVDEEEIEDVVEINPEVNVNILLELIQDLPDRYRLVFNLYVLDNFSHKEISEMLKISEGTSKSNLSRAKFILKEKIKALNTIVAEA